MYSVVSRDIKCKRGNRCVFRKEKSKTYADNEGSLSTRAIARPGAAVYLNREN